MLTILDNIIGIGKKFLIFFLLNWFFWGDKKMVSQMTGHQGKRNDQSSDNWKQSKFISQHKFPG